jgi:hypothetical protein
MRKVILTILFLMFLSLSMEAQQEPIETFYGNIRLGGILQTHFTYNLTEESSDTVQQYFSVKRCILLLWGKTNLQSVKYFIKAGGMTSPYILETKLIFSDYIPETDIAIGRFLPAFTYYMPHNCAKIDMIEYPLFVYKYGMWQQIGVQTTTETDYFDVNFGIFNGYPPKSMVEDNDGKDLMVSASLEPMEFVEIIGYGWFGNMLMADSTDLTKNRYGGGVLFHYPLNREQSVVLKAEGCMGKDERTGPDIQSIGYYVHAGFRFNPQIEILARYDSYDPDVETDDDAETWMTGGINFFLDKDHVKISLNYIKRKEEANEYRNDKSIAQFQIFF